MGKKAYHVTDKEGWTWKIGTKNASQAEAKKHIDNPYDGGKGFSKFFVTNFSEVTTAKALWEICSKFGRVSDVYIPAKRSRLGKRFDFITMIGVKNVEEMTKNLASIWIGFYRLLANEVRFPKLQGGPKFNNINRPVEKERASSTIKEVQNKGSYASVVGGNKEVPPSFNSTTPNMKKIMLDAGDLLGMQDHVKVLIARVREPSIIQNLYRLCANEGFSDLCIRHVSGLWVWIEFPNVDSALAFQTNVSIKGFLTDISTLKKNFQIAERLVWLEVIGLPLCVWGAC
ncbi:hypothetical protein LXL04_034634 [Taraxacum kok-saghyz]